MAVAMETDEVTLYRLMGLTGSLAAQRLQFINQATPESLTDQGLAIFVVNAPKFKAAIDARVVAAGAAPITAANISLTSGGVIATVSASAALAVKKHTNVDATAAVRTMTLPTAQAIGTQLSVMKVDASANAVNITGNIYGLATQTYPLTAQWKSVTFMCDTAGSYWPISTGG